MKIELKKIKYLSSLSEETNAFTADIYVDGILVGYAHNHGHGGSTDYHASEGKQSLLRKAEEYCKSLPPEVSMYGDKTFTYNQTLEDVIDTIVDKHVNAIERKKYQQKLNRAMKQHILIGNQNECRQWKLTRPIEAMLATEQGKQNLIAIISKLKKEVVKDSRVLNTNIPNTIIEQA